jgi:hypothetical protein
MNGLDGTTLEQHTFEYDWMPYAGDLMCLQVTEKRPVRDGDARIITAAQSNIMIPASELPKLASFVHNLIVEGAGA